MEEGVLNFAPGAAKHQVLKPPVLTWPGLPMEMHPLLVHFLFQGQGKGSDYWTNS